MTNLIKKTAIVTGATVEESDLEQINKYTIHPLTADQVYIFKAVVCNNEIDRDNEVFPLVSLEKMAALFIGKTVISDHRRNTQSQIARIYNTEIGKEAGFSSTGEGKAQLVAHCYMLRTESNKDFIAEIDAGIKKEVSLGCRCDQIICSICGVDNRKSYCKHFGGRTYDNQKCYFRLEGVTDAYELSFVAVPSQPNAGIIKKYGDKPYELAKQPSEELQDKPAEKSKQFELELAIMDSFIFEAENNLKTEE